MSHISHIISRIAHFGSVTVSLLAATANCWAADNTVNRCTIKGQIVFQQSPCSGTAETVKQGLEKKQLESQLEMERKRGDVEAARVDKGEAINFQDELNKYCNGNIFERLVVGMSEDQMLYCSVYRKPANVNTTTSAAGVAKQYVFKRYGESGPTHYVYFSNGRLTSIFTHD